MIWVNESIGKSRSLVHNIYRSEIIQKRLKRENCKNVKNCHRKCMCCLWPWDSARGCLRLATWGLSIFMRRKKTRQPSCPAECHVGIVARRHKRVWCRPKRYLKGCDLTAWLAERYRKLSTVRWERVVNPRDLRFAGSQGKVFWWQAVRICQLPLKKAYAIFRMRLFFGQRRDFRELIQKPGW